MQIEVMIGHQIRKFRKARRLKLEELAKASGISKALLSKIENAKVGSPISIYSKIASALATAGRDSGSFRNIIRISEHSFGLCSLIS